MEQNLSFCLCHVVILLIHICYVSNHEVLERDYKCKEEDEPRCISMLIVDNNNYMTPELLNSGLLVVNKKYLNKYGFNFS